MANKSKKNTKTNITRIVCIVLAGLMVFSVIGAGTGYEIANYDKLPNDIKDLVLYDAASKTITTKAGKFPVYETKEDTSKNLWGRIADNAWVCLKYQGEDWGTKQ